MYARVNERRRRQHGLLGTEWDGMPAGQDLLLANRDNGGGWWVGRSVGGSKGAKAKAQQKKKPDKNQKRYQINSSNRLSRPHLEKKERTAAPAPRSVLVAWFICCVVKRQQPQPADGDD